MTDPWVEPFVDALADHVRANAHAARKVFASRALPVSWLAGPVGTPAAAAMHADAVRDDAVRAMRAEVNGQGYMMVTGVAEEWFLRDYNTGRESPARFPTWEGALTISNSGTMNVAVRTWCVAIPAMPYPDTRS